jgi:hypothetical protein
MLVPVVFLVCGKLREKSIADALGHAYKTVFILLARGDTANHAGCEQSVTPQLRKYVRAI